MTSVQATAIITDEDVIRLSAEQPIEIVNGVIVPTMSAYISHAYISRNVFRILDTFVLKHRLGEVFGDNLHYKLRFDAQGIKGTRIPDVSFVRIERIVPSMNLDQLFPGAPDLAVEVVSHTEGEEITLSKIRDYLAYGSEQVWALYPDVHEVHVYHHSEPKLIRAFSGNDILTGGTLLPKFEVMVSEFFILPNT